MSTINRLIVEHLADQRVQVSLRRAGQEYSEAAGEPVAFEQPLSEAECEDLRWYLEDYLIAPYAVYEERGQRIREQLPVWGQALFAVLLGPGRPGRDAYLRMREGEGELTLISRSSTFLSLPWELLRDPERATPLALDLRAIDRTLIVQGASAAVPSGAILRVLMVIARPAGLADVGYQMVARPLIERLAAVRGQVDLNVLRPPTRETFRRVLEAAAERGEPYHVVHFDGHGTFNNLGGVRSDQSHFAGQPGVGGYLAFEAERGGNDFVSADQFAQIVGRAKVPLVVLNACRSGMLERDNAGSAEAAVEAAVATRLLENGAASVVAMGYSVYAVAAAEFMAAFYETLFAGRSVSEAVSAGRRQLHQYPDRPSPKGPLPLEDWIVPVHYLRSAIRFPALERLPVKGRPSLNALLAQERSGSDELPKSSGALASVGRFVGRDAAFYALELALQWQHVVVVHGPAGTGKTELAKAFARWWLDTGGVDHLDEVVFHSFEPGLASFGLDGVLTAIGLQTLGADFVRRTRDADHRVEVILKLMSEQRLLLIWDNFESVYTLPEPNSATPPLETAERERVQAFLAAVARDNKSGVILTSRTPEDWLGNTHSRIDLGGLRPDEAVQMAENVLRSFPRGRLRRSERAFADVLEWLDGHPLSLRLLLPHLEDVPAAALLGALKGEAATLPLSFVDIGEGRLASLGASLRYSLTHLNGLFSEHLPIIALFEGVVDVHVLNILAKNDNLPGRFPNVKQDYWGSLLDRLTAIGIITNLGAGLYGLHPVLPAYLIATWQEIAGVEFAREYKLAEDALLAAYIERIRLINKDTSSISNEVFMKTISGQRRTMGRLLNLALNQRLFKEAQILLQQLEKFWVAHGMSQEAQGWMDRCLAAIEACGDGTPSIDDDTGLLWLYVVGSEASRAVDFGDLNTAEAIYNLIRQRLETAAAPVNKINLSKNYSRLGMIAHKRGDFDAAEKWYRKCMEIMEALCDQTGMAMSYHQLGILTQRRGDLDGAESWYRKSLKIIKSLDDKASMAMSYHQLGILAYERTDFRAANVWHHLSLEISEALGDRPSLARSYHELGMLAQINNDLDEAEAWCCKSLEISEAFKHRPMMAASYHLLGIIAYSRGNLDAAEAWYRKNLDITEALGERPGMALSYHQLGIVEQRRENFDTAEIWHRKNLEITEVSGILPGMAASYYQLGVVSWRRGDFTAAEIWCHQSLEVYANMNDISGISACKRMIEKIKNSWL